MSATAYTVTGMTCGHCAASVTEEVRRIQRVTDVAVDLRSGTVTVTATGDQPLDVADVRTAVEEAGYRLTGLASASEAATAFDVAHEPDHGH